MKVVILAGGLGTRLSEETDVKPKPMVEIGGRPILWHIMKLYSYYGFNDFIICLGYKGYTIKEYFTNYFTHSSDIIVDLAQNSIEIINNNIEPWRVTLVDTGNETMTGGRIKRIKNYIGDETFMMTYGDGVSNININKLIEFHNMNNKIMTVTAYKPQGRFGALTLSENNLDVVDFSEKPPGEGYWINAGFFVLENKVFEYIDGDKDSFERKPMERIAKDKQMNAFVHRGFWKPMDTLRDKIELNEMWNKNEAFWKIWE